MNKNVIKKVTALSLVTAQILLASSNILAVTKEETVYSKLDNSGKNYSTIVSDHLKNTENLKEIKDVSDLIGIENVSGDNTFTQNGNTIVWNADNADIYYNGKTEKELPIDVKMSYTLNGKKISPENLSGKSGKLNIKIEYTNKDKHEVIINGQNTIMYTPFVVFAGTYFSNDIVKNVEVSTGKVVDDGSKTIVIGMALPGLKESLKVEDIDIPNTIEIEMDVKNYEQSNIITFVTPKIIEEEDFSILDKLDELYNKVDTLQDSINQIESGAKTLSEGTAEYSRNFNDFNNAIVMLNDGTNTLKNNYDSFNIGVKNIDNGAIQINNGVQTLYNAAMQIKDKVYMVISFLQDAMSNYLAPIKDIQNKALEDVNSLIEKVETITLPDSSKEDKVAYLRQLNEEKKQELINKNYELEAQKEYADEVTLGLINAQIESNNGLIYLLELNTNSYDETIQDLENIEPEKIETVKQGLYTVREKVENASVTTQEVENKIQNAIYGVESAYDGVEQLSQGTTQLTQGTAELVQGSNKINEGIINLNNSTEKIKTASIKLNDASIKINDGANQLYDGIARFNNEGIKLISSKVSGEVKELNLRVDKLIELSKEYNTFTQIDKEAKGDIKFIMISDAIKIK